MNAFVTELRKEHEKFMKAKKRGISKPIRNQDKELGWDDYQYTDASKYAKEYYGDIVDNTFGRNKELI